MVKAKDVVYFAFHPSEFKSIVQWYEQALEHHTRLANQYIGLSITILYTVEKQKARQHQLQNATITWRKRAEVSVRSFRSYILS